MKRILSASPDGRPKGRDFLTRIASSRPQPDEFYPKPPPTEPVPAAPTPPETPLPTDPAGVPSPMPEQVSEPERRVIHPTPPPEVP